MRPDHWAALLCAPDCIDPPEPSHSKSEQQAPTGEWRKKRVLHFCDGSETTAKDRLPTGQSHKRKSVYFTFVIERAPRAANEPWFR